MNLYRNPPPTDFHPNPDGVSPQFENGGEVPEFNLRNILTVIRFGLKRLCPNCRRSKLFTSYFTMNELCPVCGVRYEREQGEFIMAMYVNLILTEALFITGYLLTDHFFDFPRSGQLTFWLTFNVSFPIFFYPFSKSLWAGVLYLMGNLYRDT